MPDSNRLPGVHAHRPPLGYVQTTPTKYTTLCPSVFGHPCTTAKGQTGMQTLPKTLLCHQVPGALEKAIAMLVNQTFGVPNRCPTKSGLYLERLNLVRKANPRNSQLIRPGKIAERITKAKHPIHAAYHCDKVIALCMTLTLCNLS